MKSPAHHGSLKLAQQVEDVFDDAELVKCDSELMSVAVWKGGRTINFYGLETLQPKTSYSLDDGEGHPEDRETVEAHIEELFEEEKDKLLEDN